MADRYSFQSPFSRGAGADPWFTVGNVPVTTTVGATALGALGILLFVAEGASGAITDNLVLSRDAILGGQLWRFFTHTIPPDNSIFFAIIGLVFFYMIGSQFETMMGRRAFAGLFFTLLLIPAVLGVATALLVGGGIPNFGLSLIFLGVAAGFAAALPQAKSFFGIPFWGLVAFIFVLQLLSLLTTRSLAGLVMLGATGVIGLVVTRSLGFSNVEWIPAVKLPAVVTGGANASTQRTSSSPKKRSKRFGRKKKSGGNLRAVPTGPAASSASEAEIDALLDQVSEQGMGSLTKQQKQSLERHAQEMRKRRDT